MLFGSNTVVRNMMDDVLISNRMTPNTVSLHSGTPANRIAPSISGVAEVITSAHDFTLPRQSTGFSESYPRQANCFKEPARTAA